jgi:ferredoxin
MVIRIRIDEEACTGHGRCYTLAPELFDSDDYGHGLVLHPEASDDLLAQADLAVKNCPERAITLEVVSAPATQDPAGTERP